VEDILGDSDYIGRFDPRMKEKRNMGRESEGKSEGEMK